MGGFAFVQLCSLPDLSRQPIKLNKLYFITICKKVYILNHLFNWRAGQVGQ